MAELAHTVRGFKVIGARPPKPAAIVIVAIAAATLALIVECCGRRAEGRAREKDDHHVRLAHVAFEVVGRAEIVNVEKDPQRRDEGAEHRLQCLRLVLTPGPLVADEGMVLSVQRDQFADAYHLVFQITGKVQRPYMHKISLGTSLETSMWMHVAIAYEPPGWNWNPKSTSKIFQVSSQNYIQKMLSQIYEVFM